MIPKECELISSDSTVVCRDPGASRKMVFKNPRATVLSKIRVDGCVPLEGEKCDFLVKAEGGNLNFVELKGRNVSDGVSQLSSTIVKMKSLKSPGGSVRAFLICNESPSVTQMQRFKPRFEKQTGASLVIRTKFHEVEV